MGWGNAIGNHICSSRFQTPFSRGTHCAAATNRGVKRIVEKVRMWLQDVEPWSVNAIERYPSPAAVRTNTAGCLVSRDNSCGWLSGRVTTTEELRSFPESRLGLRGVIFTT